MKHLAAAVLGLFLVASSGFAGLTYDFAHLTTGIANQTISGSVKSEGKSIRIDVGTGDGMLFQNGSFAVSTDGGQTMRVVDPAAKTFYEIDLGAIVGGADSLLDQLGGAVKLDVRDPKVSVTGGADGGIIEGFPTKKSTVKSDYTIAVEGLGQPMTMRIQLSTDVWWTDKISAQFTNFLQMRGFRTGVEAVDKLLAAEAGAIDGFPLKQVTTTSVSFGGSDMTSITTSTVRNVKQAEVPAAAFELPAGLARTESPLEKMMTRAAGR
ncbi:MAG TPA: hypothetical protein VNA04_05755 [Thermoanaerobaculia bacterium]|nr:hypothetical protein [Thermoanaerobaculia bacterium]